MGPARPTPAAPVPGGGLRAWLELVRLPNVFTAAADVLMGFLIVHGRIEPAGQFALLMSGSVALYWAGMILNDYFDRQIDARERPARPIPSGRIAAERARAAGAGLLAAGAAFAAAAASLSRLASPVVVASSLAGAIVLYNAWAKSTWIGPAVMGSCRALNVLLGTSTAARPWGPLPWTIAAGIGVYVAGVTWFSRGEAGRSPRVGLAAGAIVMAAGLAVLGALPQAAAAAEAPVRLALQPSGWRLLIGLLSLSILWRCGWAVLDPTAGRVQTAVRIAILSLIVLDAAVCLAIRGGAWATLVLLLLVPALYLGRWLYST